MKQMQGPGRLHGYRMMHERCRLAGLRVTRDAVCEIQTTLDPEAVALRKGKKLRRRSYSVPGPNYMWHMDSYDKLTPFGIGVNGCIDGFSRHIIWMKANSTNSNPCVIAAYYVEAVTKLGGCSKILRSDRGTENVHANRLQMFFREDDTGEVHGTPCVIQGRSTANQRIESWWGMYRRQNVDYWRDVFREFQATGDFSGDFIDKGLIQFCFLKIVQEELDTVVRMWDNHRIRPGSNGRDLYHGKPVMMYNVPELYHAQNYLHPVEMDRISTILDEDICQWKTDIPCDIDLHDLCLLVMEEHNLTRRHDAEGAIHLYKHLRPVIKALLEGLDE
ncbi:uncharacterized protein LOC121694889 isoform X2 [Alosa sapidissima]|uniref:uncharacterized protein LOC121694889 isoform X2 n=1 Tax=Alosa sapidissima TaxID=34773 RepID=UPI001C0961B3|nr:uncharacterized protein LOC121694889 isoform X2 [Alosa sapidissima]